MNHGKYYTEIGRKIHVVAGMHSQAYKCILHSPAAKRGKAWGNETTVFKFKKMSHFTSDPIVIAKPNSNMK